jgi:hypothetical protein
MAQAIDRACPPDGWINQSGFIRMLLHTGLAASDAEYRAAAAGGMNGGGQQHAR